MVVGKDREWFREWLAEEEMICVNPNKNPSPEKIETYCRTVEDGDGCPNLIPECALVMKEGTVFGKRKVPIEDLNFIPEE